MRDFQIPPIGTRVAVQTESSIAWMNFPKPPIIGVVSESNPWDKPNTFRLTRREDVFARHHPESVIAIGMVKSLIILEPNQSDIVEAGGSGPKTYQIEGSNDNLYTVVLDGNKASCNCQAGTHGRLCKHVKAARLLQV